MLKQIIADNWISILIFFVFLAIQIWLFLRTKRRLNKVAAIFPVGEFTKSTSEQEKAQIDLVYNHDTFNMMARTINNYITENSDSIDLNEMKDIVNRTTEKEYDAATSDTAFPMYLGLMGTYLGVAYGLFELVYAMANTEGHMFGSENVYVFIGGVVVAMLTSLFGLIFTTLSNNKASSVSESLDVDKGEFFSFLQIKILPSLPSTLAQTLKTELQRSIGTLGTTIGALDQTVRTLNTELRDTFQGITSEFGDKLTQSLSSIQQVVTTLTSSASDYAASMQMQDQILTKMNSAAFSRVLDKIASTVERCDQISETVDLIEEKSDSIYAHQSASIELQQRLLASQVTLYDTQEAFAKNVQELGQSFSNDTVQLHERLNNVTLEAQRRLNTLMQEPVQMYKYIETTMEQFARIERFVESVTAQEFDTQTERIENINSQIRAIENAGATVRNYLAATKSSLEAYLDTQKDGIMESAEDFVTSWNRMFSQMAANGAENPLVYLKQLSGLEQRLDNIKASIETTRVDKKVIDELDSIRALLQELKTKAPAKNPIGQPEPVGPKPEKKKGFFGRLFGGRRKSKK